MVWGIVSEWAGLARIRAKRRRVHFLLLDTRCKEGLRELSVVVAAGSRTGCDCCGRAPCVVA
eukprot:3635580-Pyramimonas_sp.AAC.1